MIEAENVTKYYGPHAAVRDLSFKIAPGEVVGLLGRNGAGKTTTLKILSGLLLPTCGRVHIAGLDMQREPEAVRARIGFLPERPALYPEMTVAEFLVFAAHIKGLHGNVRAAVERVAASTDLCEVLDERIDTLSNGYQRRVAIAQAVVHEPGLILLDEPTSGLDPVQIVHMRKLILKLRRKHTVLVSSHILGEIHQLCDRIFVLEQGRIVGVGTEEELARQVSASMKLSVEVRGGRAALEAVLRQTKTVQHFAIDGEHDGRVEATLELAGDERAELARALVQADLGLLRFERVHLELENIFLKLTSGEAGASLVSAKETAA